MITCNCGLGGSRWDSVVRVLTVFGTSASVPCRLTRDVLLKCNEGPTAICAKCPPFVEGR